MLAEHHVARFQIAVDDPLRVRGFQRFRDLQRNVERFIAIDGALRHAFFKGWAVD